MMRLRPALAVALAGALALSVPAVAAADVRVDGHGFGHGVGLSQYGAYGYALKEGRDVGWIVDHYYPGTRLASGGPSRIRVRLVSRTAVRVAAATAAKDAAGRRVRLSARRTYRLTPWQGDGLRVEDTSSGRTTARLHAPLRISGASGGEAVRLLGRAENGVTDGAYRGALILSRDPSSDKKVLAVDDVALEQYLWGVVAAEMPASWPDQALRAQAVVARSYGATSRDPSQPFDVYADTRSQVYRGVAGEAAASTAAVDATRRLVVLSGDRIAETLFHASSGGQTAAVEEVFSSAPIPYLVAVDDPYDTLSPYHDWTVSLSDADAAKKLGDALRGDLVDIGVTATTATGRARTVRVTGTLGAVDVPASTIRTRLGLRSTWFAVTHTTLGSG